MILGTSSGNSHAWHKSDRTCSCGRIVYVTVSTSEMRTAGQANACNCGQGNRTKVTWIQGVGTCVLPIQTNSACSKCLPRPSLFFNLWFHYLIFVKSIRKFHFTLNHNKNKRTSVNISSNWHLPSMSRNEKQQHGCSWLENPTTWRESWPSTAKSFKFSK